MVIMVQFTLTFLAAQFFTALCKKECDGEKCDVSLVSLVAANTKIVSKQLEVITQGHAANTGEEHLHCSARTKRCAISFYEDGQYGGECLGTWQTNSVSGEAWGNLAGQSSLGGRAHEVSSIFMSGFCHGYIIKEENDDGDEERHTGSQTSVSHDLNDEVYGLKIWAGRTDNDPLYGKCPSGYSVRQGAGSTIGVKPWHEAAVWCSAHSDCCGFSDWSTNADNEVYRLVKCDIKPLGSADNVATCYKKDRETDVCNLGSITDDYPWNYEHFWAGTIWEAKTVIHDVTTTYTGVRTLLQDYAKVGASAKTVLDELNQEMEKLIQELAVHTVGEEYKETSWGKSILEQYHSQGCTMKAVPFQERPDGYSSVCVPDAERVDLKWVLEWIGSSLKAELHQLGLMLLAKSLRFEDYKTVHLFPGALGYRQTLLDKIAEKSTNILLTLLSDTSKRAKLYSKIIEIDGRFCKYRQFMSKYGKKLYVHTLAELLVNKPCAFLVELHKHEKTNALAFDLFTDVGHLLQLLAAFQTTSHKPSYIMYHGAVKWFETMAHVVTKALNEAAYCTWVTTLGTSTQDVEVEDIFGSTQRFSEYKRMVKQTSLSEATEGEGGESSSQTSEQKLEMAAIVWQNVAHSLTCDSASIKETVENLQKPDVEITIGNSDTQQKCIYTKKVQCDIDAGNPGKRLGDDKYGDAFKVYESIDGRLCAKRTDSQSGWGLILKVMCTAKDKWDRAEEELKFLTDCNRQNKLTADLEASLEAQEEARAPTRLLLGESLEPGAAVRSSNGRAALRVQKDGNLVVYSPFIPGWFESRSQDQVATWSSNTNGQSISQLHFQEDGNVVLLSTGGRSLWASGTNNKGAATMILQDDCNLVIYDDTEKALWSSGTKCAESNRLDSGSSLRFGEKLISANGKAKLSVQEDGNVVLFADDRPIWETATSGHNRPSLNMQSDGNLVLYQGSTAVWHSATYRSEGDYVLLLRSDCSVAVYSLASPHERLWSSGTSCSAQSLQTKQDKAILLPGESLKLGQALLSANNQAQLVLRSNGELYVEVPPGVKTKLIAKTARPDQAHLKFQHDSNVVLYRGLEAAWASGTQGKKATQLVVQNDCNVVVYAEGGNAIWASATSCNTGTISPGEKIENGDSISSPSNKAILKFTSDNLELWGSGMVLWSKYVGRSGYAILQNDGNFVIYRDSMHPWASNTVGEKAKFLRVTDGCNLELVNQHDQVKWHTDTRCGSSLIEKTNTSTRTGVSDVWDEISNRENAMADKYSGISSAAGTADFVFNVATLALNIDSCISSGESCPSAREYMTFASSAPGWMENARDAILGAKKTGSALLKEIGKGASNMIRKLAETARNKAVLTRAQKGSLYTSTRQKPIKTTRLSKAGELWEKVGDTWRKLKTKLVTKGGSGGSKTGSSFLRQSGKKLKEYGQKVWKVLASKTFQTILAVVGLGLAIWGLVEDVKSLVDTFGSGNYGLGIFSAIAVVGGVIGAVTAAAALTAVVLGSMKMFAAFTSVCSTVGGPLGAAVGIVVTLIGAIGALLWTLFNPPPSASDFFREFACYLFRSGYPIIGGDELNRCRKSVYWNDCSTTNKLHDKYSTYSKASCRALAD